MRFRRKLIRIRSARMRFRPVRHPFRWFLYIMFALFFISLPFLYTLEDRVETKLLTIARSEVKNIIQTAVKQAVTEVKQHYAKELNDSIIIGRDTNGHIHSIQINQEVQAKIYETLTETIQRELKKASQQKRIHIPLGAVFDSELFADWGPDIPLQYWPKGSTHVDLEGTMEGEGINVVMIKLNVRISNEMAILIPNNESTVKVNYNYPLSQITIMGDVPENYFYFNGEGIKGPIPVVPSQ